MVIHEMKRVIKYVLDTKDLALRLNPTLDIKDGWSMVAFSDSDYATDPEKRLSAHLLEIQGTEINYFELDGSRVHCYVRVCKGNQVCTSVTYIDWNYGHLAYCGASR
jgi:hypothetical protein